MRATPPPPREESAADLARYLLSFRWPERDAESHELLVDGGLLLWRTILGLVPPAPPGGRALEIGSPPFNITLLLRRFRRYELSLTGFAADGRAEIHQELASTEFAEHHEFVCRCFDVERDRFPYDDAQFDLVLWCEVIEHLVENPVHALAEIHRVLKPGGVLVLSTPNVARADNVAQLLQGGNIYDPYHLGAPLEGSRHSREYTYKELAGLVGGCGFAIDRVVAADMDRARTIAKRLVRLALNRVVGPLTGRRYRGHLFLRARRTAAPFRWHFPPALFDPAHLRFVVAPHAATIVMGATDEQHLGFGWGPVRPAAEGRPARRATNVGDVYLVSHAPAARVVVVASAGEGELQAWHGKNEGLELLGRHRFRAPADRWQETSLGLGPAYRPGTPVHVRIETPGGVDVHAAWLE